MVRTYLSLALKRAWSSAMTHVIGESLGQRAAVALLAVAGLAVPAALAIWHGNNGSPSRLWTDLGVVLIVYLSAVAVWFAAYVFVIAPYELWHNERQRAEKAEAALTATEAARVVAECTKDGVVDLMRLRAEMDRITDPDREMLEEWDRLTRGREG